MAQSGFTPISIYYSATATNTPTAGNLVAGELAINTADGKLFYKDSSGVVQVLGTKGGVGSSTTTQVLYNSSGLVVGSANMTFSGTALTLANDASISGLTVGLGAGSTSASTVLGVGALSGSNTGNYNTAIGKSSLLVNTSGSENVSIGFESLKANTTGAKNVSVGTDTMASNTTGSSNTALGWQSLVSNTTASNNTAVGYQAGYSATANGSQTFMGYTAGYNSTGTGNSCFGYQAGASLTSGSYNTVLGYNMQIQSCSGSNNVLIGNGSNVNASGDSNSLLISTVSGIYGKGGSTGYIYANGSIYQGNNSATWAITSDARLKKNIVNNTTGLDAINAIQVRNFEYRTPDEVTDLPKNQAIDIAGVQLGAIAQELQTVLPDCVKTESTGVMSLDTTNLTWYLINAVKELNAKLEAQALEIATLKGQ